ncbi:hypothetical protein [Leptospira weilii]|nr:hypothetical protein [Leptospira weilii]EMN46219.1 hypothetical protein LEP1GSC086_3003 [Leptospira weilii str. LNT 1234]QDK24360.1 SMI1/KNR4 family protein [Leptospira weilii]QDK28320.1 SMI1/KNR4 family protein [Leptospira weilii]ULH29096.1 hypothetical protein FH586_03945 [Leptospira weilii]
MDDNFNEKMKFINIVLKQAGVIFESGLTQNEILQIENKYNFKFPPDLIEYLSYELPISNDFVNWRDNSKMIQEKIDWPFEGMCFDIKNNSFWIDEWGEKPSEDSKLIQIAKYYYDLAPKMIPICSHRYIPDQPNETGNPIFSIYQTDIIYYGNTLLNYLMNEFEYYFGQYHSEMKYDTPIKEIKFWSKLVN